MKCNTYEIDPTTKGSDFKSACKASLAIFSIPVVAALVVILIGSLITAIF